MAEEKENTIEEVSSDASEQLESKTNDQPRNEKGQFVSKFDSAGDDSVVKVDLSKPPPQENKEVEKPIEEEKIEVVYEKLESKENTTEEIIEDNVVEEIKEDVIEEVNQQPLQEVTSEDVERVENKIEEAIIEAEETGKPIPDNLKKLMEFMDETGGDLNDYVKLNRDISKMDDSDILDEYYRTTKSHLTAEERNYLLEDSFGFDEEVDDERSIRMKKIALKEQVAEAKAYLDGQKSKYYEDIKAGSKLTQEQQQAIDFFNRYNKESKEQEKINQANKETFLKKTNDVFNDKFKGFEYNVGDKKYRFNVKNVDDVRDTQSNPRNFMNKFVDENKQIKDMDSYHKSFFTAMNADNIAKHFYEQGKADAIKQTVAKDKNINTDPRQTHGETNVGGVKYRVLGENTSDMKNRSFKIRKKN